MNFALTHRRMHRIASAVLMVGFIYQLGACPCGCLQHNYWAQALGMSPHDSHEAVDTTQLELHPGHGHDCRGVPARVFINNSRAVESPKIGLTGWVCWPPCCTELKLSCNRGEVFPRRPHDLGGDGRTQSELQIFLL